MSSFAEKFVFFNRCRKSGLSACSTGFACKILRGFFSSNADNVQVAGIFAVSRSNVHVLSRTVTFLLAIATRTEYSLEA